MAANDNSTSGKMPDFVHAKPFDVSALNSALNMSPGCEAGLISDPMANDAHYRRICSPPILHPLQRNGLGLNGSGTDLTGVMHTYHNQKPCAPLPSGFFTGVGGGCHSMSGPATIHSSVASSNSSDPDLSLITPSGQMHSSSVFSPAHSGGAVRTTARPINSGWPTSDPTVTSPMLFNSNPQTPSQNSSSGNAGGVMALAGMLTLPQRCIPPHTSAPGTYYEHLNVKRTATRADIDAAYRRWRHGGYRKAQSIDPVRADTLDRVIIEATLVLSNEGFRAQYDNYLN